MSLTAHRAVNSSAVSFPPPPRFCFFLKSNCVEVREIILIYTRVNVYAGTTDKRSLQPFISNFGKLELIVQQDSGGDMLVTPSVLPRVYRARPEISRQYRGRYLFCLSTRSSKSASGTRAHATKCPDMSTDFKSTGSWLLQVRAARAWLSEGLSTP